MQEHFLPIERHTHRTPAKYRRIAVRLAEDFTLEEIAYLFRVTTGAVQHWIDDPDNYEGHENEHVGTIEVL